VDFSSVGWLPAGWLVRESSCVARGRWPEGRALDGSKRTLRRSGRARSWVAHRPNRHAPGPHAQHVVEEHPIALVDIVFGVCLASSSAASGYSIRAGPSTLIDRSASLAKVII
jgi:hypothetical protein